MSSSRNAVAIARRDQVIDAATAVIVEQGIQNLSLSEIEKRAGMARGHLTYYFPTKEDILLAVFDRVLQRMHASVDGPHEGSCPGAAAGGWELTGMLLRMMLSRPLPNPEFGCLQHTFLAQAGHREDFRKKLAELYEFWRSDLAAKLEADAAKGTLRRCPRPRAMSTLIQALLHGLAVQSMADPNAFDTEEVLELCLDVLGTYLGPRDGSDRAATPPAPAARRRDRAQRGEP